MDLPVAVITGAAGGIGLELAKRLRGTHRLALLVRDIDGEAAAIAAAQFDGALVVACDITNQASVEAAVTAVVDRFGVIDVAVSNAGIGVVGAARHLDPEVLAVQLDVNLIGNWRFIHACLPHLERSRGYLLGVASAAAIFAPPGEAHYAASKAGLEALLNVLRVEVAQLGIGVGIAYLLFIDTPMLRDADQDHPDFAQMRALLGPAGRAYPAALAADRLAAGIRRRSRRVFVPPSLRAQYVLRRVAGRFVDREFRRIAVEVDRLTAQKVAARGGFAAGFSQSARITRRDVAG
jgi:NAD(P)-dependent dehydrogenase (short-subunit alcohol dehydrogenase family)